MASSGAAMSSWEGEPGVNAQELRNLSDVSESELFGEDDEHETVALRREVRERNVAEKWFRLSSRCAFAWQDDDLSLCSARSCVHECSTLCISHIV